MNLALDAWIPVRRANGQTELIAPWQITDSTNLPLEVDATRAPWNAALTEFLIVLYQTVLLPDDAGQWRERWDSPPSPDYLRKELSKLDDLFSMDSPKPFMQDPSLLSNEEKFRKPVQKLFVDGVSELQEIKHSDLFMKSGRISMLCLPCAAAALWDLQAHAPQGGKGYHTSLRGGGPSSTLIVADTLWKTVWANVLEQSCFAMKGRSDPKNFMPWNLFSERKVDPDEESPLHVFWGMPRRVLLKISGPGICDTCGRGVEKCVREYLTQSGGLHYAEIDWRHPHSPYIRTKDQAWCVRPTEADLVGYRHWMGLLVDTPQGDGVPALVVRRWIERNVSSEPYLRIWGYGYQTDQAAITSWCEGKMPIAFQGNGHRKEYEAFIRTLIALSQRGAERLSDALRHLWGDSNLHVPSPAPTAVVHFWRKTEPLFRTVIEQALREPSKEAFAAAADAWIDTVRSQALDLYEDSVPRDGLDLMWTARHRHKLARQLSGRDPVTLKTRKYGDWRITDAL